MRRPSLPNWETLKQWGHKTASVVAVLAIAAALYAGWWGLKNADSAKNSSAAAAKSSAAAASLAKEDLNSQNNHHASTVKKDAQLQEALNELQASAEAIKFEGGVIAYQDGVILQGQQQGHATLALLQALQTEIDKDVPALGGALKLGQAQINAYLGWLGCLDQHQGSSASCGDAPPLPPTSN